MLEKLKDLGITVLRADGFDDAVVGITLVNDVWVCIYDEDKIIEKLTKDDMSYEEAREYFEYNILGAYMGTGTPVFMQGSISDEWNRNDTETEADA
jgi:hypothetical protein